jgi:hypothetical protein
MTEPRSTRCSRRDSDRRGTSAAGRRARIVARALLAAATIAIAACSQLKPVERRAPQDRVSVTATVAAEPQAVQQAIVRAFAADKGQLPEKWRRFSIARPGEEYFPRDDQIELERGESDALARYLAAPAANKRDDLFAYDFSDADDARAYWPSEYYVEDRQAPFRSNFLIHLVPSGAAATEVEVLELSPRVWVGKKFSVEAHGPGTYLDVRNVAPTTADRIELLELVRQLVK